jgi:PAS domain S-box-containing protein
VQADFNTRPRLAFERLRRRLRGPTYPLLLLLIFIAAVIWAATLLQIQNNRGAVLRAENLKNSNLAHAQEDRVLRSLQVLDQAILILRHNYTHHAREGDLTEHLNAMHVDAAVGVVSIIGPEGAVLASNAASLKGNFSDREYFQFHERNATDQLLVGKPIKGKLTGKWLISLTRRLNKADGSFDGVVFMAVDPTYFITDFGFSQLGPDASVALIGTDGIVRVRNRNGKLSFGDDLRASQLMKEIVKASEGNYVAFSVSDGIERTVSYRVLRDYPLVVAVNSSIADLRASEKSTENLYLGLATLCTALVGGLGLTVYRASIRIEDALRQARTSERKFKSIIDASPIPMAINNDLQEITYVNPAFTQTFGYRLGDISTLAQWWHKAYPDAQYRATVTKRWADEMGSVAMNGSTFTPQEVDIHCKDGSTKHVIASADKLSDSLAGEHLVVLYDLTAQRKSLEALNALVKDKNALLREVHHRVKNNLQVISSLLRLDARKSAQQDVKAALTDMNWRIRSMALLHESLYRADHYASVDLAVYLRQLATEAARSMIGPSSKVTLSLDLSPVTVNLDQATPCGLIVNELISNALKHGFIQGRSGTVTIRLAQDEGGHVRLSVSDDGVGLPVDFEYRQAGSLGLQLISDLVQQMGAVLTIGPAPHAVFSIDFKAIAT